MALIALLTLLSVFQTRLMALQPLAAWSDPDDGREAIYVHAPAGACAVSLEGTVIIITMCEDTNDPSVAEMAAIPVQ